MIFSETILRHPGRMDVGGVPQGMDALLVAELVKSEKSGGGHPPILYITRDDVHLDAAIDGLAFFAPDLDVLAFPAWDCLPYDRVSPHSDLIAQRMSALARLAQQDYPQVLITTVNAISQRIVTRSTVAGSAFKARIGETIDTGHLTSYLAANGYARTGTVTEPGDYALRGGLIDLFPPGAERPVRLDLFGDEIESIRQFDVLSQRTVDAQDTLELVAASEIALDPETVQKFRHRYVSMFGPVTGDDPLYEAISAGRAFAGAEHWLPLFHEQLETLFDYLPDALVLLDHQDADALQKRREAIRDYYAARQEALGREGATGALYRPVPPESLYLSREDWEATVADLRVRPLTPFHLPEHEDAITLTGKTGRDFTTERNARDRNLYEAVGAHLADLTTGGRRVILAGYSTGAAERMRTLLTDHGVRGLTLVSGWQGALDLEPGEIAVAVLALERGFSSDHLAIVTEQDILGDRLVRKAKRQRRAEDFIAEASSLSLGDLVVHTEHGIGRFDGLETITVNDAPHDCVKLTYAGDDRLYVPVENIEVLSRYGSGDGLAQLDRLGGTAWQTKKAKLKSRIREMAGELIKVAASRALRKGEVLQPPEGVYDEFCARFPYVETDDQARAIDDVIEDLKSGRPMDRLVCGDVGFGKTEVALRAAFVAALNGVQVAIVAPTTLLARQHTETFKERFRGLPVRIEQLSRLVSAKHATRVRDGLTDGQVDIVIGTHALLAKSIKFKRLGLLIVDEEQHFGVAHKERLKQLRSDVHVLTLTATPIPRTLQLAMAGIRDLSLIASPPVDRLAVRTYVAPFDEMILRDALLRELYRGGQSFFVCPRVADLDEAAAFLREVVPEVKFAIGHGQMPPAQIEDVMSAFLEKRYDVLLSTAIVESGLDIPSANTLVVFRADRFGLAQLYQLRGRVGRSKVRAYAYLTIPPDRGLTEGAVKRLEVLQALDTLGAGFTIASHDMDIRGAGNLLGEEQSGHVREVGVELYQHMLEEAVAEARAGTGELTQDEFSPQINVGATVLIPERYVPDLDLRMALYRRLAGLTDRTEIDAFAAELIDRFGPLPGEVKQLMIIIEIKGLCREAGIAKIEAGPKGATLSFHRDQFANPGGLIEFITGSGARAKLKPDHRLVYLAKWDKLSVRLGGVRRLARGLADAASQDVERS